VALRGGLRAPHDGPHALVDSAETIDSELFSLALEEFAREVGAGPRKTILVVLDGAGWHTATDLRVPDGIVLVPQPPYTPEMQPAEHL
jgi:hypothetical protein